jgi:tRNA-Thr(GGU) m(6)t(6)A37 methyltransferase TsaA
MFETRAGEEHLPLDPAMMNPDAQVVFIGTVRSPWTRREDCPKNMREAHERGRHATVEIAAPFRPGLRGLAGAGEIILLTWLHHAPRNLIVQKPRHASEAKGVFALRSPARPNPVGLHLAGLTGFNLETGILTLDAIDVLDGTPVIDIKPYFPSVDTLPGPRGGA